MKKTSLLLCACAVHADSSTVSAPPSPATSRTVRPPATSGTIPTNHPDEVSSLPNYGPPPTKQYSGFLDATKGCDTEKNGRYCRLHYWLALSEKYQDVGVSLAEEQQTTEAGAGVALGLAARQNKNGKIPVVLWLNGGPGSSSLIGFLEENGPLLLNKDGKLAKNPYSWTKHAHVLALEQPVGVGFSYCEVQKAKNQSCHNSDKQCATASHAALVDFFKNKFPALAGNDFYITGESYAGVYIPTLAKAILDGNAKAFKDDRSRKHLPNSEDAGRTSESEDVLIPLKGVAVGDPCTDDDAQKDSMDMLWYTHKNGLVQDQEFEFLWNTCQARSPSLSNVFPKHFLEGQFYTLLNRRINSTTSTLLSRFKQNQNQEVALTETTAPANTGAALLTSPASVEINKDHVKSKISGPGHRFRHESAECKRAWRKFQTSASNKLDQGWAKQWINPYSLFSPAGDKMGKEDSDMGKYLNSPEVRAALHVTDAPVKTWPNDEDVHFLYEQDYAACNWAGAKPGAKSMIDFYRDIAPKLEQTVVLNGDTDPCVSYEGTRTAIERLGFAELDGHGYRPWFYHKVATPAAVLEDKAPLFGPGLLAVDAGPQFGGEVVNYEHNVTFMTFHGSGHMVPQFRPQASLHFLKRFLAKKQLSPAMASNRTLETMTDSEFAAELDAWTDMAKKMGMEGDVSEENENEVEFPTLFF
ncbi:unnamed protein product [Amoebophrya sp. A120]|nr:unnamed protein product [Amoebophrya sp. A120]|eukprot:GSA120T00004053001.1